MSTLRTLLLGVVLAATAACSDDAPAMRGGPDAPPDAPPAAATFADFVKDLIVNRTADNTPAVAVDLTSPDSDDPNAFASLFR